MMSAQRGGFTLIEVALAVLVIAIGVMAIFALISGGLAANADAIADTQAALFAETVFNTLQVMSEESACSWMLTPDLIDPETGWRQTWENLRDGIWYVDIGTSAGVIFGDYPEYLQFWQTPLVIRCSPEPFITICFSNAPQHDVSEMGLVNCALRYKLEVNILPVEPPTDFGTERVEVTLKVWDGRFGSCRDEDAMVFYSEFDSQGDL